MKDSCLIKHVPFLLSFQHTGIDTHRDTATDRQTDRQTQIDRHRQTQGHCFTVRYAVSKDNLTPRGVRYVQSVSNLAKRTPHHTHFTGSLHNKKMRAITGQCGHRCTCGVLMYNSDNPPAVRPSLYLWRPNV